MSDERNSGLERWQALWNDLGLPPDSSSPPVVSNQPAVQAAAPVREPERVPEPEPVYAPESEESEPVPEPVFVAQAPVFQDDLSLDDIDPPSKVEAEELQEFQAIVSLDSSSDEMEEGPEEAKPEGAEGEGTPQGKDEDRPRGRRRRRGRGRGRNRSDEPKEGGRPPEAQTRAPKVVPADIEPALDEPEIAFEGRRDDSDEGDSRRRRGGQGRRGRNDRTEKPRVDLPREEIVEDLEPDLEMETVERIQDDDSPIDNLEDWNVPSWSELIASLYRPDR